MSTNTKASLEFCQEYIVSESHFKISICTQTILFLKLHIHLQTQTDVFRYQKRKLSKIQNAHTICGLAKMLVYPLRSHNFFIQYSSLLVFLILCKSLKTKGQCAKLDSFTCKEHSRKQNKFIFFPKLVVIQ